MKQYNLKTKDKILKYFSDKNIKVEVEECPFNNYFVWVKTNIKEAKKHLKNLDYDLNYQDGRAFFFLGGAK